MFPTHTEALPSDSAVTAKSTGDTVIQLCDTGKLNSMPKAAQAPRYAIAASLIDGFA